MYRNSYTQVGVLIVLILFVTVPSRVWGQLSETDSWIAPLAEQYSVVPNITYHTANNNEAKLDLYLPRDKTWLNPTVIFIHGGGWIVGSKENYNLWVLPYIAMGWAVVNVEYRLANVALAPGAVEDCRCALWWVLRNAKVYNFDPEKIVISGQSAGGHLALTTGMLPVSAGLDNHCPPTTDPLNSIDTYSIPLGKTDPKVAAIINWYGITDVVDLLDGPNQKGYAVN